MISYKEAQKIIISNATSFGTEIIDLDEADGRVLAEDVFADRNYPPFNRSAMDGYAIRYDDWESGIRSYPVQEVIFAGKLPALPLGPGAAFKIMTGASVPPSADSVIRKEDAWESLGEVSFSLKSLKQFQNIAREGEDIRKGDIAVAKGTLCKPAIISTLATLGCSRIMVNSLPRIALFTTGNEVKSLDTAISAVEIRNSNYYLVRSLLRKQLIKLELYEHLDDNPDHLQRSIKKGLEMDIIILSGGVSAGDADYVPETLERLGVERLFHKVAIKPGKPFWCGKAPNGPMVFALPGNPFSTLVTFSIFIKPFLEKSTGVSTSDRLKAVLNVRKTKKTPLDEFFPARLDKANNQLTPTTLNGSGDIRLGLDADVLAVHPAETDFIEPGQVVDYYAL